MRALRGPDSYADIAAMAAAGNYANFSCSLPDRAENGGKMSASKASRTQHAVRLLTLLRVCGDAVGGSDPTGMVQVIRAEKRLQALDFWLRNPDYLADELVNRVEIGKLDTSYIQVAERMLLDPEPSLHHLPMHKWFYGAYEAVDDAFGLLQAYGLAFVNRRGTPGNRLQNQFFLTELGAAKADELESVDRLRWYPAQAALVHLVAGDDTGTKLKERQYQQEAYAETTWGSTIATIREQVETRISSLRGAPGAPASNTKLISSPDSRPQ